MNRDALRKEIVNFVGEKRLPHVLGTEKECLELAGIFGMSDADREKLAFAALLHDITKSFSPEEHEQFAESRHICLPAANTDSPKTLHAVTGAYMAEELFPDDADETVFSAIRWHTTGKAGMTLTEKLMYPCRLHRADKDISRLREAARIFLQPHRGERQKRGA